MLQALLTRIAVEKLQRSSVQFIIMFWSTVFYEKMYQIVFLKLFIVYFNAFFRVQKRCVVRQLLYIVQSFIKHVNLVK